MAANQGGAKRVTNVASRSDEMLTAPNLGKPKAMIPSLKTAAVNNLRPN
jgi:hypothetical protein